MKVKVCRFQAVFIAAMLLGLFPLLWSLKLPPRIQLAEMARLFFLVTGLQAAVPLCAFYLIQRPVALRAGFTTRGRILMFLLLAVFLWCLAGGQLRLFLALLAPAVLVVSMYPKVAHRKMSPAGRDRGLALAWAVLYLFAGMVVVFSYDMIASAMLDYSRFDGAFLAADRFLLFGHSVAEFSRTALSLPEAGPILEAIYYGLFPVMGATILWLALESKVDAARAFICDVLTCHLITLVVYWIAPSIGPFLFSPSPAPLPTMQYQRLSVPLLAAIHARPELFTVGVGYFIAFPCMHITQSALVAWHLRSWPRLLWAAIAFNGILLVAILGLQWHYAVDILGGLAVATLAVLLSRPAVRLPQ